MTARIPHPLTGSRALVVGLGRSGLAAARLLAERGVRVTVNDQRSEPALRAALTNLRRGVIPVLGGHPETVFRDQDLIVVSPGVGELPALEAARAAGVPVLGEVELAAQLLDAEIIAITGTNGKSTVTSWIGEMVSGGERPVFVGGNLGEPLIEAVSTPAGSRRGLCVVELSSFQLETCQTLRPKVALLLNLAEDHLDRYPDMDAYVEAKGRIFAAQREDDWAVTNWDEPDCRALGARSRARQVGFSLDGETPPGSWLDGESLHVEIPGHAPVTFGLRRLRMVGRHNQANALAAAVAAVLVGTPHEAIEEALGSFSGLPHRMELVGEVAGVRYYNDSKATNVSAVKGSLSGFPSRFVLIAGGRHKGAGYHPLRNLLERQATGLVLLGEAADQIASDLAGVAPIERADSLDEAVVTAASLAQPGEAVVLSPACSSYDMFQNFEARGAAFAQAVARLEEGSHGA